ncbi:hypothetical protein O181_076876 [Austropuccinia psidii MF-1]|uniref:Uncharacterized protein n=1 Tax=Austropuccinia psidii MF-1 TaxID=1389203 RepID=A0A9Q3IBK5_9BASI|nr:hypothetical protein [Austropuccinia psidii MF-1]
MMHNWMEGILSHHFCIRWGFQDTNRVANPKRALSNNNQVRHRKRQKVQEGEEVVEAVWAMDSEDSDEESNGDDDVVLDGGESGGVFDSHLRTRFCEKLAGVVLPANIKPLPNTAN